jgi:glycerol-3-phosphate dehydrogenase (NAD(P)+)
MKIAVIGSGAWGFSVGKVISENGHDVIMWSHRQKAVDDLSTHRSCYHLPGIVFPESMKATTSLQDALTGVDGVVLGVSSPFVNVLVECAPFLTHKVPLLILTKGLMDTDGDFFVSDYIKRILGDKVSTAILSGPNLAPEVAKQLPAATVIASEDHETAVFFQKLCSSRYFRVYTSSDVRGVEVGGILKNVIAVASGMMDAMGLGKNATSALISRGLNEIAKVGEFFGAKRETFMGLSGVGDLVATCISDKSRNFQVGYHLAQMGNLEAVLNKLQFVCPEGVRTSKIIHAFAEKNNIQLPIVSAVYSVVYEGFKVEDAIYQLMGRELRTEF